MSSKLFQELKIGSMTMKNAAFMAPMSLGYESQDGTVNEVLQEYASLQMHFQWIQMCHIWEILFVSEVRRA